MKSLLHNILHDISVVTGISLHELKHPRLFLRALLHYLRFRSQLGREDLFASIAILVLSLVGTWEYVASVIADSFRATARALVLELCSLPGLLGEVKKIVEEVVFRDGTLPYTAREHVLNRIKARSEAFGNLVLSVVTAIASLLMFYICALFMSFMPGASVSPEQLLVLTLALILGFSLLLASRAPVADHALPEVRERLRTVLATCVVTFLVSYILLHDLALSVMATLTALFVVLVAALNKSRLLDKVDNATLWDRLFTQRLVWHVPTDVALERLISDPETRTVYVRTWPYSALYELSRHVEHVGELRVSELLRDLVTATFLGMRRAWGQTLVAVLVLVGFALGMLALQAYMTVQYVQLTGQIYVPPQAQSQMPFTPQRLCELLVRGLDIAVSWVPPVAVLSSFLILRAVSSTSRAAKICLVLALPCLAAMLYLKLALLPSLIMRVAT